jgi:aromatic-L-amino-acid decarboxylase
MSTKRNAPIEMTGPEFRQAGYRLIDQIAGFIENIETRKVTSGEPATELIKLLQPGLLPGNGSSATDIVDRAVELLFNHSLFNGHPKFFGYITSSAAPLGALADLLAAAVNPNVGAQVLSPVATEIEKQVIRWLCAFIGLPAGFDGLLVSGGNMANFTAFFTAINIKMPQSKKEGLAQANGRLRVYCCRTTHTWIEKAAALAGLGTNSIQWIPADEHQQMDTTVLAATIATDKQNGLQPIIVIATAGDVSTGAVDDLKAIGAVCALHNCWFHIDGAYGIPAAAIPDLKSLFNGINDADSIALDPHKWLYAPLEAGCTLVKDPNHLIQTYSSHPVYYNFSNEAEPASRNFYEYGFQNSRGFRALKVWMLLQQAGKTGYVEMIEEDIRLSKLLYHLAGQQPELQPITQHLSITTLRYCPPGYTEAALNKMNESLLNELQQGGDVFLSNALVNERYCLRACIVNFRTTEKDIEETIDIIVRTGRKILDSADKNSAATADK